MVAVFEGVAPALIGHLNCNEQLVKPALTVSGHAAQDGLTAGRVPTLCMYTWLAKSLDTEVYNGGDYCQRSHEESCGPVLGLDTAAEAHAGLACAGI